ncbi:MAG: trypsin-like peptidase domain-containing protein [Cyanobacteriota bacterium]|nr:trypsin-like peptidase domain-containing protein [Cyanobacteriota bacterium]
MARIAQTITVSIDGAVQGSGVLVEQQGNRYTVLTAWHVIGDNRPGEEVAIATADGQSHKGDSLTMRRLASDVDLGVISFEASNRYAVANLGDSRTVAIGEKIYVAGFPLPTAAVPIRMLRFLNGDVQANATMAIPNGYQLLYSNPTLPGMSGGAVLNSRGELVGIHGQGETANKATEQEGIFVKTGTNQAVPVAFFKEYQQNTALVALKPQPPRSEPEPVPTAEQQPKPVVEVPTPLPTPAQPVASRLMRQTRPETADDYLAQARQLFNARGNEQQIIELMRDSIALKPTALAYFYRAKAKNDRGDVMGAMNDFNEAMRLNPAIGAKATRRGRSTGESSQGKEMAMRLAMEELPKGAAVIEKSCQDVQVGPDNYKTRCTVVYTTDVLQ